MTNMKTDTLLSVVLVTLTVFTNAAFAQSYKTYSDAVREANTHLRSRAYAKAEAPLEAALDLVPSEREKLHVYRSLMSCYRLHEDPAKMIEAAEYVIANSVETSSRSLIAGSLISFLHQRGKLDGMIDEYKRELEKDSESLVALTILSKIDRVDRSRKQEASDFQTRLEKVEKKLAAKLAEKSEIEAQNDARTATYHLKEAARYWIQAGEKEKAVATAKKAIELGPDNRSPILTYFWHDSIGSTLLEAGEPELAVGQFEAALKVATIEAYKKSSKEKLEKAKALQTGSN